METKWKNRLAITGILCSLPIICAAAGITVGKRARESDENFAPSFESQAAALADRMAFRGEFAQKTDRENAPVQTEFLLDDESAQFSNGWAANTTDQADERFGDRFAYAGGVGSGSEPDAVATWEPVEIVQAGWYQVYARWTAHENRAPNAPYTISWGNRSVTVTVNQQTAGGVWNPLQSVYLEAGDILTVSLANNADGYVVADGIRIVLTQAAEEDRFTITVEFDESGGSIRGKRTGLSSGESTTLTAEPNEGWRFTGWYMEDRLVCAEPDYTLSVTQNIVLTARFERIPADKQELKMAVERAEKALADGLYNNAPLSVQREFSKLLEDARELLERQDALQDSVDEACKRLTEFLDSPILPDADKSGLKMVLDYAGGLNPDSFVPTGKKAFSDALEKARAVYGRPDAGQDEVDRAMLELLDKTADLRIAPEN